MTNTKMPSKANDTIEQQDQTGRWKNTVETIIRLMLKIPRLLILSMLQPHGGNTKVCRQYGPKT